MIGTLTVGGDPRSELRTRLELLQGVDLPRDASERGEAGHLGTAALRVYSEREIRDVTRLLSELVEPLVDVEGGPVRLNDCVALRDPGEATVEEFVVHAPGLIVRAPGFISADSALGAAVLGKRVGDAVVLETRSGSRSYLLEGIRRSTP